MGKRVRRRGGDGHAARGPGSARDRKAEAEDEPEHDDAEEGARVVVACVRHEVGGVDATKASDGRRPHPVSRAFRLKRNARQKIAATERQALRESLKNTSATRGPDATTSSRANDSCRDEGPIQVRVARTIAFLHSTGSRRAHIIGVS
jgi:hypothetical protein